MDENLDVLLDRSYGAPSGAGREFIPGIDGFAGSKKWRPYVEFTAAPGNRRSLGQVNLFAPLMQDGDSLLFTDLRASAWTNDVQEGNFGLGYRQIVPGAFFGSDAILGVYGFFDARHSAYGNMFYQGTLGAELITDRFEFRVNGYLPSGNQYVVGTGGGTGVTLNGRDIVFAGGNLVERALPGFDVEAGVRIDFSEAAIRLNAGYFRFERGNTLVEGPRFRAEVEIDDPFGWEGATLSLGGEIRDDKVRGTEASGLLRLRVPIGGASDADRAEDQLTSLERQMTRRIIRDDDIVTPLVETANTAGAGPVRDAATGETLQAFFVANTAQGAADCSSVSNACDFVTAQGLAGAGDTFLPVDVAGAIGAIFTLNADRQNVIGAGGNGSASIALSDAAGSVLVVTSLGGRPIVTGVNIGHFADTRVAGLSTSSATGIIGDGMTGTISVSDVILNDGGFGFSNSGATISVTDAAINSNAATGIELTNYTGPGATFSNADVVSTTGTGLRLDGGSGVVTLDSNSSIAKSGAGATIEVVNAHTGQLNQGGQISATGGTGLQFNNADGTYNFTGPSNLNGGDAGIDILGGSAGTFSFGANTAIMSPTGIAFNVDGSTATVTYAGTITQNNAANAVSVSNNTGGSVTLSGLVTANTSTATGINLTNNGGATVSFAGGLDIDTSTGTGFNATGGGTVNVAATGGNESVSATSGQAINLNGVVIGASGITFDSVASAGSASTGVTIDSVTGGAFTVSGPTTVSGSTGNAVRLNGNSAAISFNGATGITMTSGSAGVAFSAVSSGAVTFADLDIALQAANSTGVDLSGATLNANVTATDFDLTSTSTTGTTGVDLSGTSGTGTIQLGDANVGGANATIAGVDVGVQFTAGSNATFIFGDGEGVTDKGSSISGNTAIAGGSSVTMGSYDFDDVNFTGTLDFTPAGSATLVFVAANATGDGSGSDVNNRANVVTADAITTANTTFVLIDDGAAIDDTDGFTLHADQTMASFGNGRTFNTTGIIIPANFSGVPGASSVINDPTGNGAAILTNSGVGDTLTLLGNNAALQDFEINNGTTGDGLTAAGTANISTTGMIIRNVGAQGIDLDNVTGTVTFNNTVVSTNTGNAIDLNNTSTTFGGGLDIATVDGIGLNATGGGTIGVSNSATEQIVATGTGTALNLDGVAIAGSGVTFDQVTTAGTATGTGIDINDASGGTITLASVSIDGTPVSTGLDISGNARTSNVVISGGSIANGAQIRGTGAGTVQVDANIADTTGYAVQIANRDGSSGAITVNGTVTGSSGAVSLQSNTGGDVTFNATVTGTGANTSGAINVDATTGGTVAFAGFVDIDVTGAGTGVSIDNSSAGGTFNFTGGLDIDSVNGIGFEALSGTVSVAATGADESVTTSAGQALNLNNMVIGAGGVTFDTVSSTNAGNGNPGIRLDTLTGAGGVTITNARVVDSGGPAGGNGIDLAGIGTAGALTIANIDIDMPTTGGNNLRGISSTGGHTSDINLGTGAGGVAIDDAALGIQLTGTAGTINVGTGAGSGGVQLNTLGQGINIGNNATGTINIGNTATTSVIDAGNVFASEPAIALNQADATVTVTSIDINGSGTGATGHGIYVLDNDAVGSFTLNGTNTIDNTGGDGIRIAGSNATISGVTIGAAATGAADDITGNGVNVLDNGQAVSVSIDNVTVADTRGAGIRVDGSGAGSVTINSFNNNTVTDADVRGVDILDVTFDAVTGGAVQQVTGGNLSVGTIGDRVEGDGVRLDQVLGNIAFGTVNVFNNNGTGLFIRDAAGKGGTFAFGNTGGTINTTNGAAVDIDPVTMSSTFANLTSTNSAGRGVNLDTIAGTFTVTGTTSVTGSTTQGVRVVNSTAAINLGTLNVSGTTQDAVLLQNNGGGSFTVTGGTVTKAGVTGDALDINGGAMAVNFGANISHTSNSGDAVTIRGGTTGNITISGTVANTTGGRSVDIQAVTAGTVSFTGATVTDTIGMQIQNVAAGAAVTFSAGTMVTLNNPVITGINLSDNAGAVSFNGAVDINNAGASGIVLVNANANVTFGQVDIDLGAAGGADAISINGTPGTVTFGVTTITNVGAAANQKGIDFSGATLGGAVNFASINVALVGNNVTAVDLTGATINANLTAGDFDVTSTSSTGTVGINLAGATGTGIVQIGDTNQNGGPSVTIGTAANMLATGVQFNAATNLNFTLGDGDGTSGDLTASDIHATTALVGTLPTNGSYNFRDIDFNASGVANLSGPSIYYVDAAGAGSGASQTDAGSIAGAESFTGDVIALIDTTQNTSSDSIDMTTAPHISGGAINSLDLDDGQVLISLVAGQSIDLSTLGVTASGAPGNFFFTGIASGTSTVTGAATLDSVAPTLTTNLGNTVNLAGSAGIEGVTATNTGTGNGIEGVFAAGENVVIRSSTIGGGAGQNAIDISTTGGASTFDFSDVTLTGGLDIDASVGGTLTGSVTGTNTITTTGGSALRLNDLTVGTGGINFETVNASAGGANVGISVVNVVTSAGQGVNIGAATLSGQSSDGVFINGLTGAGGFTLTAADIDGTSGDGVHITGANTGSTISIGNGASNGVTGLSVDGTVTGVRIESSAGTVNIASTASADSVLTIGANTAVTTGFNIINTGATVNAGNATTQSAVTATPGIGVNVFQAQATANLNFRNFAFTSAGNGINVSGAVAAGSAINGTDLVFSSTTGRAIFMIGSGATSTFTNVDVNQAGANGIEISGGTGSFTLNGTNTIDNTVADGIFLNNTVATISNVTLGAAATGTGNDITGAGIRIDNTDATARTVALSNITMGTGGAGDTGDVASIGVDINSSGSGVLTVNLTGTNTIRSTGQALDVDETGAGTANNLLLNVSGATFESAATGVPSVEVTGQNVSATTNSVGVRGFANNTVIGNSSTSHGGILFTNVDFDSNGAGGQVAGGTLNIGQSAGARVRGDGLSLINTTGDLAFTTLNVFNDNGTGVEVNTKGAGTTFNLVNGGGTVNTTNGTALFLDPLTMNLQFGAVTATGGANGVFVDAGDASGGAGTNALTITTLDVTGSTGAGVRIANSTGTFNFGATGINNVGSGGAGVDIDLGAGDTAIVSFTGGLDIDTTTATGFDANGAAGTNLTVNVVNTGTETINTTSGAALNFTDVSSNVSFDSVTATALNGNNGIALADVFGSFTVSGGTITNTGTGAGVVVGDGSANSGGSGTVAIATAINSSGATGFAANIRNVFGGAVTLSGNLTDNTAAGGGINVSGNTGGSITFSGSTKQASTATNPAVQLTSNTGGTINFTGGGLVANTTTGTAFTATGSSTINVSGAGNTLQSISGSALVADGVTFGATFASAGASALNGNIGIDLNNISGNLAIQGGSITNSGNADAIEISGGAGSISIATGVNSANATGLAFDVRSRTGGTVTLSGNLSDNTATGGGINVSGNTGGTVTFSGGSKTVNTGTSTAVSLTSNTGATVNFTGGNLDIDATTGTGFNATGGGTVTVQGTGSSVTTTTGTAVNISGTTIGGAGVTFQSVSSNGAGNGIVLIDTGAGGFTVTGDGTSGGTLDASNNNSGGAIVGTSGNAISLTNTGPVSISQMRIGASGALGNIDGSGIRAVNVSTLTVNNTDFINVADQNSPDEAAIFISGAPAGATVTLNNNLFNRSFDDHVRIENNSAAMGTITVNENFFNDNNISGFGNDAFLYIGDNGSSATINITSNSFFQSAGDHIQVALNGSASADVTIGGAAVSDGNTLNAVLNTVLGSGITLSSGASGGGFSGNLTYLVQNNTINNASSSSINVNMSTTSTGAATYSGSILNNTIGTTGVAESAGFGIAVTGNGSGTLNATISSNIIREHEGDHAILVQGRDGNGRVNATITSNTVTNTTNNTGFDIIGVAAGATGADNYTVCADIRSNSVAGQVGAGGGGVDIALFELAGNNTIILPGYGGAADGSGVAAFLQGQNTGTPSVLASVTSAPGSFSGAGAACP